MINAPYFDVAMPHVIQLSPFFSDSIEYLLIHVVQGNNNERIAQFSAIIEDKYSLFSEDINNVLKKRYGVSLGHIAIESIARNAGDAPKGDFVFVIGDFEFSKTVLEVVNKKHPRTSGFLLPAPFDYTQSLRESLPDEILKKTYTSPGMIIFDSVNSSVPAIAEFLEYAERNLDRPMDQDVFSGYMSGIFFHASRPINCFKGSCVVDSIYSTFSRDIGGIEFKGSGMFDLIFIAKIFRSLLYERRQSNQKRNERKQPLSRLL